MSMENNNNEHESKLVREELEAIAPKLASMKKNQPFGLPEDYFSSLEHKVMQQIKQGQQPVTPPAQNAPWWAGIAFLFSGRVLATSVASILVLSISLFFLHGAMNSQTVAAGTDTSVALSGISQQDLNAYVLNHADDIDLSDMDATTLNTIAQNYKIKDNNLAVPGSNGIDDTDDYYNNDEIL